MEKQIYIIYPYRFREFDNSRYEVECLNKYSNTIVHELLDCLYPHFSDAYSTSYASETVKRFSSLIEWKKEYLLAVRSCKKKAYVINHVPVDSFGSLFVNYIIRSSDVFLIEYKDSSGVASYVESCGIFGRLQLILKFAHKKGTFKWFIRQIISQVAQIFSYFFARDSDYLLMVGKNIDATSEHSKKIQIHSFDYSIYLKYKYKKSYSGNNTIVFLDGGTPFFKTDDLLLGSKVGFTVNEWYPSLLLFFDWLEKEMNCTVVIAAHPKHKYNNEAKKVFNGREVLHNKTVGLVKQSSLVLTRASTAISYAIMFKKPIIVLTSNELVKNVNTSAKNTKYLKKILGCQMVNIDSYDKNTIIFDKVDSDKYLLYEKKYLSSRGDSKHNCNIIIDEIINNQDPGAEGEG